MKLLIMLSATLHETQVELQKLEHEKV